MLLSSKQIIKVQAGLRLWCSQTSEDRFSRVETHKNYWFPINAVAQFQHRYKFIMWKKHSINPSWSGPILVSKEGLLFQLWNSVIVLCFVVRYFMSILVLQSSWWGRESWLHCFVCLPAVSWLLCGSSSRCHGFVCSLWLWYFLIILTIYNSEKVLHTESL